jgi:hypothetical protein
VVSTRDSHGEHPYDQQRVQPRVGQGFAGLGDEVGHPAGRVEGQGGGEDDADAGAVILGRFHMVGQGLVVAAVAGVLGAVFQQDAVQLLDVVFG